MTPATQPWPGTFYPESPEQIAAAAAQAAPETPEAFADRLEDKIRAALVAGKSIDIETRQVIRLQDSLAYESSYILSSHFGCRIDWTIRGVVRFMPSRRRPTAAA